MVMGLLHKIFQGMVKVKTGFRQLGRVTVLVVGILLLVGEVAGQTNGDYRTRNTGNWNSSNTWQVYNGGWNNCAAGDYPGVTTGAGTVTILTNHNVTLTNSPLFEIGELIIQTGNNATTLTYSSNWVLSVIGDVNVSSTTNNQAKSIVLNTGTLNCNNLTLTSTGGNDNRDAFVVLTSGTLNVSGNLTMNASGLRTYIRFNGGGSVYCGATITGGNLTSAANGSAAAPTSGTVYYDNTGNQNIGSYTYYNLTVSGGGTKQLTGNTTVSNNLTLNSGIIRLDNYNLTLSNNAATAVQGTPGAASYVETNGTGNLVRNIGATLPIAFPVGSGGYYSPMSVDARTGTTGTVSVKAVPSVALGSKYVSKYWDVVVSNAGSTVSQATFTYDIAEAVVSPTNIWVKPNAGVWQVPVGTASFGANSFTITGTTNITTTTSSWTASALGTYYSYQSGSWNDPLTWTSDPGGTTQVGSTIPDNDDIVVILSGRTVSLPANIATTGLEVNINEGGTLDMSTFSFTSVVKELNGNGTLRLASSNFPTVTTNNFVLSEGGTTEYYNSSNFNLPTQATYNHLRINTPGVVSTLMSNIVLNGNLHIKQGTFRINDNTLARRELTINGNVTVDAGAFFTVGTGQTYTTATPTAVANGGTAPFINYYYTQSHTINIKGDFLNNGTVRFTNQSYPVYNLFPNDGFATVYFTGATSNTLTCNGSTDFYNLVLDKGIDQSFSLTVYSSAYPNFRLFGANIAPGYGGTANPNLQKALWIRTGSLVLKGLTVIPSLTESNSVGTPNGDFFIPSNGALVLDGSEVVVLSTADDYREVNVAYGVSGPSNAAMGIINTGGYQSFSVYGKFQVNDGYFSTRESGGLITWNTSSGQFVINGGTIDAKQFRSGGGSGGLASYDQSGGTLLLRGRFQRTPGAYSSISDLINAPVNTTRATSGLDGTLGTFNLNETANVFTMSGGTIRIYDVSGDGSAAAQQKVFEVMSASNNINVTGGTLELTPLTGTGTNSANHIVISKAPLGNLTINRASSASVILLNTYPLVVKGNFNIASGDFNANNLNVSVGGNFTVSSGTTYTTGSNWTILNGTGNQLFTVNLAGALSLNKFKMDKPAGSTLTLAGTQSTINVSDSVILISATLADGGKIVNFTTSGATTTSYIYNSGTHSGTGRIVLADNDPQIIDGDGDGVFQNLELNNNDALTAPISLAANATINGTLTFSQDKLLDIKNYNLKLGPSATIVGASTSRFVQSNGDAGDGGITKVYSSTSTSFVFPIGASSTRHAAAEYSPASISFGTAPTAYGAITVIPVGYEHPNTTAKNRSLTYFWRVKSTGFTLGAGTVTHSYTYSQNDVVTSADVAENGYIAAWYNNTNFTWTSGNVNDVNETTNIIGGAGTSYANTNFIDAEITAGDNTPTNPFGVPTKYYSRINGAGAGSGLWSNVNTWSLTGHTGAAAASVPGVNDIVIIGGKDSVYLATNTTVANTDIRSCATLQIEVGSALDIGFNPGCNFAMVLSHSNGNGNFRVACDRGPLVSTTVRTFQFPSGDFSEYNINFGTTELYTTNNVSGTTFYLPNNITSYGNLIISPLGGSNIIFGNTNVTIYGNCITRGQNADSWFLPTWDADYPGGIPRISKKITILGNLDIQGGAFGWYGNNGGGAQDVIVHGDVIVASGAGINVWSRNTSQSLSIGGSLINNANNIKAVGVSTRSYVCLNAVNTIFFGSDDASVVTANNTSYGGGAEYTDPTSPLHRSATILGNVIVNKGSSQTTTLTFTGGNVSTPVDNWLTLQNGTLQYRLTDPRTDFTISTATALSIPASAGLEINLAGNANNTNVLISNINNNNADLILGGKLSVISGNVYIGPTNGTTANNNDIEYSGGGSSEIEVQGGRLVVNGQIRRNPATTNGILKYIQAGGDVQINGQAAIAGNAKLEICNPGSVFNMSGGNLAIVRGGGTTYGDLYIRAESSNVTGGNIIFSQTPSIGAVDAVQNYILDANVPLYDLTITGKTAATARTATVTMLISPLVLNGSLTLTNNQSILDMNTNYNINLTVKGGFTNNGTYNHYNNLTTFSGGVQSIQGSTATDFYNLLVNPVTSLSLIRDITVYNDLTLSSGQLLGSTYNINVKGNLINNANYDGSATQGGVILNGTALQLVSGTGTFGRLEINNPSGARLTNGITLQKNLILTTGIFDINQYLLTLGANSSIEGSSFGPSKMIASDGVYSNVGVRKYFPIYSGASQNFTFPIGTTGKYTPAVLSYTDNTNVGYIRINNINSNHPGVIDPNNVLNYFWEVTSSGISGFNGSLVLNYKDADVQVTGSNSEADYIAAALLLPGTSWSKSIDNVDETNNTITFVYSGAASLSGEYTAGIDPALPNQVPEFTSVGNGNWSDPTNWTQTGGDPYTLTGAPNGFIVIIESGEEVTMDVNHASAYRTTINGTLRIVAATNVGHNLGTISGSGTLYLEGGTIPAGRYSDFLSCSNNSIIEYSGNTSYTIVADLFNTVPRLHFTGSGSRVLPNKDLTICTQLLIDGPTVDNSVSNRKLTIQGTMERYNTGAFISGTGAGAIVSFAGSAAQTFGGTLGNFSGTNSFNHLEINNTAGLSVNTNGTIDVSGNLMLTSGNINTTATNKLTITNTTINCVFPSGGRASSFVNGPLIKRMNQGDNFLFPIGKGTTLGNKLTISATQTGTLLWTAEFFTPNATYPSFTAPLTYVNSQEYWTIGSTSGSQAIVNIKWDPLSDLTPLMTQNGITDMRVSNYNTATTSWTELTSTASGDNNNGSVSTVSKVIIPASGSADYTIACINVTKPRARLNPSGAICGVSGIPVTFSGVDATNLNYILSYNKGGVPQTPVVINTLPYTLPTDATGTTYQLTAFTYNNPPHSAPVVTGVVDPAVVTSYTVPTTSNAGSNQSLCGATTATLNANTPVIGTGLWTIVSGTGGTVITPTSPTSTFNGTNGSAYTLRWTISNGGCTSSNNVNISFPLLPVQPTAFTSSASSVCQGQTGVAYAVANDPNASSYNWSYTGGSGATLNGSGNSITYDFATNATSGTVSVSTTNGCGTSSSLTLGVTVNIRPSITLGTPSSVCVGTSPSTLTYSATLGSPNQYSIDYDAAAEALGFADVANTVLPVSPINLVVPGTASAATYNATLSVRNSATLCTSPSYPITITINPLPVTGPMYRQPNN